MTPATDATREARARKVLAKHLEADGYLALAKSARFGAGMDSSLRAMLAFADTEAASQPREGDEMAAMLNRLADENPGGGARLRAVDLRAIAAALTKRPPEQAGAVPAGEVERLRKVLADATPVPWRMEHGAISAHIHQVDGLHWLANCVIGHDDWHSPAQSRGVKDATLIVEAVNALPKLLAILSAAPTPPDAGPGEIPAGMVDATVLGEVMQDAWSEICDDAGSHPSDMKHGRGTVLFYSPGHWTDLIAFRLSERLTTPKVAAIEAGPYRVRDSFGKWYVEKQFSCINGLSAWFSLAEVSPPNEEAVGYTDGAIPDAEAFARQVAAALNAALTPKAPPQTPPDAGIGSDGAGERV